MKFIIPGEPIAKMRHRFRRVGNFVQSYDPQDIKKKEVSAIFSSQLLEKINSEIANLACSDFFIMSFSFYMGIPFSSTLAHRNAKLWHFEEHVKKPDASNLIKFYEDCANGILYPDDALIISGSFKKEYSENPRTEIEIVGKMNIKLLGCHMEIFNLFSPNEMKEFMQDVKKIATFADQIPENYSRFHEPIWYSTISTLLMEFSEKHATKIKKISTISKRYSDNKTLC